MEIKRFSYTYQLGNDQRGEVSDRRVGDAKAEGDKGPNPELPILERREEVTEFELGTNGLGRILE